MGANQTKVQEISPKTNFNPATVVVAEKHVLPHFGEVRVVKNLETEQDLIKKEVVVFTKQAFDEEINALNGRLVLNHPNVVQIIGYNSKEEQNFCSASYRINVFIEHLEQTLQAQLEERTASHHAYTEIEILQIADALASGLAYFQSQGISHGDIRPQNIFVHGETVKLSDPYLAPQKGQTALTLAIVQGQKTLLAPELLAQVPKNDFEVKTDKYKADTFSLGLTLLSLASLSNVEELNNYEQGTLNEAFLNEKLERLRTDYSHFTVELIRSMLTLEEANRPDFVGIEANLQPYQEYIRSGGYSKVEKARRSALPEDDVNAAYNNVSNDELEARIRAILDKCEDTFLAVEARDKAFKVTLARIQSNSAATPRNNAGPTGTTPRNAGELAKSYVSTGQGAAGTTGAYNYTPAPTNYQAAGATNYGSTSGTYGTAGATNYGAPGTANYGSTSGTYGTAGATNYGAPGATNYGSTSGTYGTAGNPNYGTTNYGTTSYGAQPTTQEQKQSQTFSQRVA